MWKFLYQNWLTNFFVSHNLQCFWIPHSLTHMWLMLYQLFKNLKKVFLRIKNNDLQQLHCQQKVTVSADLTIHLKDFLPCLLIACLFMLLESCVFNYSWNNMKQHTILPIHAPSGRTFKWCTKYCSSIERRFSWQAKDKVNLFPFFIRMCSQLCKYKYFEIGNISS